MIQQYGSSVGGGGFNATSAAGLVKTRASAVFAALPNGALPASIWGFAITNCDAAATLYLAYGAPTSSNYYRALAPGATWEVSADVGMLNTLQVLSSAASTPARLEIFR